MNFNNFKFQQACKVVQLKLTKNNFIESKIGITSPKKAQENVTTVIILYLLIHPLCSSDAAKK